jgi:hypothetical protein
VLQIKLFKALVFGLERWQVLSDNNMIGLNFVGYANDKAQD